jgi:L-lactate utilization protein LutC
VSGPEMQKLDEISKAVTKLEVNERYTANALEKFTQSMERFLDRSEKSDVLARKAEDRASSAHHRIDEQRLSIDKIGDKVQEVDDHFDLEITKMHEKIDKGLEKVTNAQVVAFEKLDIRLLSDRRWRITTGITLLALTATMITLILRVVGM